MGIVYRAQDPAIGRIIAIKSIRLNELTDPEERSRLRDRLFREAQSAGILSHPNIVTIYDILEENDLAYIFMEFVNGMPLDDLLRSDKLPSGHVLITLLSQTANALDYAHKKGIIHRDIKPANVMVHEDSIAKVCDFGIAKITSQSMTQTGVVMGTPSYMSPELIKGETLTGASDQFALGIMAYEILTGQKPFKADYLPTLFFKVCSDEPPAVHDLNPTLTPLVDRAVRKALAKKPEERYHTCAEFMKVLERAIESAPDWIPLSRRPMPVTEESTTGSGGRVSPPTPLEATTIDPSVMRTGGPSVADKPVAPSEVSQPVQAPQPVVSQSQSLPAMAAPQQPLESPQPQPAVGSTTTRNIPAPPMTIPIREEAEKAPPSAGGMSKAVIGAAVVALLAVVGYFGYSKMSAPAETQAQQQEQKQPEPATPPTPPAGVSGNAKPSPVAATPAKPVPAPVTAKPEGKEAAPAKDKDYDIAFASAPPGATVTVDGSTTCKSPCSLPLKQGRHSVQFVLPGFVTTFRPLEVPSSLELTVTMPEATGVLMINTNPKGATIILDGQNRPEVTPARLTLREGVHKIDLVLGNLRDSHEVTIKQGSIQQIQSTWQ